METYSEITKNQHADYFNRMDLTLDKLDKHDYSSVLKALGYTFKPVKVSTTFSDFLVSQIIIEFRENKDREMTDDFNEFTIPIAIEKLIDFKGSQMYIMGTLIVDGEIIDDRDSIKFGLMTVTLSCKLYDSFGDNEIFKKLNWAPIENEVKNQIKMIL